MIDYLICKFEYGICVNVINYSHLTGYYNNITIMSNNRDIKWAVWRLKSPTSWLFVQQFVQNPYIMHIHQGCFAVTVATISIANDETHRYV